MQTIIKIQQSQNPGPKMFLIYDQTRAWNIQTGHVEVLAKLMPGSKPKRYFFATLKRTPEPEPVNNPLDILEIGNETSAQDW